MRRIVALGCFLIFALAAQAQIPGGNIYVGYSYLNADVPLGGPFLRAPNRSSLNGWTGSLELKVIPWLGGVAEVGGNSGTQPIEVFRPVVPGGPTNIDARTNLHTYMFGPRVSFPIGRITPFAEALFGAGHARVHNSFLSVADTSFSTAIGGGLDYRIIHGLGWRVQADYLHTRLFNSTQANFRASTGLVLHF